MNPKVFSGTLYFDDESSDRITVHRFIVREEEVAFHLTATWNGRTTLIELDGKAVQHGNLFTSERLIPKPLAAGFHPVTIELNELDPVDDGIYVAGVWRTKTIEIAFSGDLAPPIDK